MACTKFASTNSTDLSYIKEIDCGVTPATPTFQILPTTGGGPTGNISTSVSEVIRSDRMTDDLVIVDSEVSGSTNYELSFLPYSPIIKSLLLDNSPVTLAQTAQSWTSVTAATGDVVGSGTSFTTDYKVGYFIKLASVTDSNLDGIYKIVSITSDTAMNIGAAKVSADIGAVSDITVDAEIHRNGTAEADNYTILKRIVNGANTSYFYYRGCQISSMSYNFETGSILNGSFDVIGLTEEATEIEFTGTVGYDNPPAYSLMNAVSSVTEIDLGGLSASTEFSNMNLTINNNMTPAKAIGTLGAAAIAPFTLDISADTTVYFEDTVIYNKYLNADSFYVDVRLVDGDENVMIISMPKAKFSELDVPVDGKDNFMFQNSSITALREPNESYMIQVAFIAA